MSNTCGGCPASWTGQSMAHCGSCHCTFSSVGLFDAHRVSYRCVDPASLKNPGGARKGLPVMRLNDRGTWVGAQERPEYWKVGT